MSRGRLNPGQRLDNAISARAWNRAQDAADIVLGDRAVFAADGPEAVRSPATILVRNDSGFPVPILGVLKLTTPVVSPAGGGFEQDTAAGFQAKQFYRFPVMIGVTPGANDQQFCVTLEPIAVNGIGRAVVSGVTTCKIKTLNAGEMNYAATRNNDRTQLIISTCGPARVLWVEPGAAGDDRWALVVL